MNLGLMTLGREKYLQAAEPLVTQPSACEFQMAIEKLNVTNHQVLIKFQQN
jgi:hypothetical protein